MQKAMTIGRITLAVTAIAVALSADLLGMGQPGFGPRQMALLVVGAALLVSGPIFRPSSRWTASRWTASRLKHVYVSIAIFVLNSIVLLLVVNLVLGLAFVVSDAAGWTRPGSDRSLSTIPALRLARASATWASAREGSPLALNDEKLARIYPGWTRDDVAELIEETRGRRLTYQPFSQFREPAHQGRFVNVSEHGFRIAENQRPWPMSPDSFNIWLFGGSTTFGYGVADGETIPTFLQQYLADSFRDQSVAVYNFGQGYYYSSQELALFQQLLVSQDVHPNVVVFIDGINESFTEPYYSSPLRQLMKSPWTASRPNVTTLEPASAVTARYFKNRKLIQAICRASGIWPLFVWQPNPAWHYDLRFHFFLDGNLESTAPVWGHSASYEHMETYVREQRLLEESDFLYLADFQFGVEKPLYVDRLHYTAEFARRIAGEIGQRLSTIKSGSEMGQEFAF